MRPLVSRSCTRAVPRVLAMLGATLLLVAGAPEAAPWRCPGAASFTVFATNLAADAAVELGLEGEMVDADATCDGTGATTYSATVTCRGTGLVECGRVLGLRPGAWIHRVALTVAGSAAQMQASRSVVLADAPGVSNVVAWTIYPRTYVVDAATETSLRTALDAAATFTRQGGGTALVRFASEAFPGASAPRTIELTRHRCTPDGRFAGFCVEGSDVVVDARDGRAERGAVVLAAGTRPNALLRVYGARNVLRGLVLRGSTDGTATSQIDTVAFAGAAAQANRIEDCQIVGPARGDGVSVEDGAGRAAGPGDAANVVEGSEVGGAERLGLKVTTGGRALLHDSCVHGNRKGGVLSTEGGTIVAVDNLVQANAPGNAPHGLAVGTPGAAAARSVLTTDGNIVRFNGARGLSVSDNADAVFGNDYVADNQFAGARVETTTRGTTPVADFRGVALVCNHNEGLSGTCEPVTGNDPLPCATDADCCAAGVGCCASDPTCAAPVRCAPRAPQGFGAVLHACADCERPLARFGDAADPGRNAFTLNVNTYPNAQGANFRTLASGIVADARGNQWERCGAGALCDVAAVAAGDLRLAPQSSVVLGTPAGPRAGIPVPAAVSIGRPRAGDLVRVFGVDFNAIDAAACARTTAPVAPCNADDARVVQRNQSRYGNLVQLTVGGETVAVDVHAVTPTMLAFRMPIDCFAPAALRVSKRGPDDVRRGTTIDFCDAGGCQGVGAGAPCDDGSVCTVGDRCGGADEACVPGPALACGGPCMTCDPVLGCVPRPSTTACDDGSACTVGDHCSGDGDVCVPGAPLSCDGACLTGVCDPAAGCVPEPTSTTCDDGTVCTVGDHCRGDGDVCVPGAPLVCAGACLTGACDPAGGCVPKPATAACDDGSACTVGDHCDGAGDVCLSGDPRVCAGACLTGVCDPGSGCVPEPATLPCDDGSACTLDDHCSGTGDVCVAGAPRVCTGTCLTGACDPTSGCRPRPATFGCSDGDACTLRDRCRGDADVCVPGPAADCDDRDPCTTDTCDAAVGCAHDPFQGYAAVTCRLTRLRAGVTGPPGVGARLARRLDAALARVGVAADAAYVAADAGAIRKARRLLASARNGLRNVARALKRPRGVPEDLAAELRDVAAEAVARVEALRVALPAR